MASYDGGAILSQGQPGVGDGGESSAGEGHGDGGARREGERRGAVLATLAGETTSDDGGAILSQG